MVATDGSVTGWGATLYSKPHKYSHSREERLCRYASGKYHNERISGIDAEVIAILKGLDSFKFFLGGKTELTVRTDCEARVKFDKQTNEKKITRIRWLHFIDRILNDGYHINFEHVKGKENALADALSRLENPVEELVKALHPNKFKRFADGTAIP